MVRAGMIRKVAAGIYNILPLGLKAHSRVENIVREEMNRACAQEVFLPMVIPSELWRESGRWDLYGKELLRVKDRHNRDFCLGPTHEEVITDLVRGEVRSYRDLPLNLYQIQTKFRDEIRPRFGLMRGREFIMKDAYSFHATEEDAESEYRGMYDTYCRIFERCGLEFRPVEAETGTIGGSFSHEFMVLADTGEDAIATCDVCGYAANVERAEAGISVPAGPALNRDKKDLEMVHTPGLKTVDEVSGHLKIFPDRLIKTLIYSTDRENVVALVRGDHELNEAKLKRMLEAEWVGLADEETVRKVTGGPSGFSGPVGLKARIVADYAVESVSNGVTGANEADMHFINVNPGRDFHVDAVGDLKMVVEGDRCARCEGTLAVARGIEVGHIFKLGTKYSEAMGATFLDERGKKQPLIMGCYGIGIGRVVAATIEQSHDERGIVWPHPLSPFHVYIVPVNVKDDRLFDVAEDIYDGLNAAGLDVLLDDREERAGVKFNDADLIGIPVRITVSNKTLDKGGVEIKKRREGEASMIGIDEVTDKVKEYIDMA